jgi:hypothetical protein
MPTVKPSDKSGTEGEWWRKNKASREENDVDPDYAEHIDQGEMRENQFDEEQRPVKFPT